MQKRMNRSRCRSVVDLPTCIIIQERVELDVHGNGNGNGKGRFVERINARNLSTAGAPLMRYVSQLRRKHTSLYAVLKLSIFKTMNACSDVVERPADDSWLIAGNVY